jgi:glutamine synthetase
MSQNDILSKMKEDRVSQVMLQFSDLHGLSKSFTIPVSKVKDALQSGVWFDGSSIVGFTRIAESDMYLKPDAATYGVLPWVVNGQGKTARMICDVYTSLGEPFSGDPRFVLKQAMEKARALGYIYKTGVELEFFLFDMDDDGRIIPESRGNGYYFNADISPVVEVKNAIFNALGRLGIDVEMSHSEVAENQHEIDFKYADAITTADNAMTFKFVV